MELDKEAIKKFKQLYLQEYGIQLTDKQAYQCGSRLVLLVKAVYGRNLPEVEFDKDREKDVL